MTVQHTTGGTRP